MKFLDRLSLKPKLALVPALCLALLVCVSTVALTSLFQLGNALASLYDERLPSYTFASQFEADLRDMNGLINQSLVFDAVGFSADQIAEVDGALKRLSAKVGKDLEKRQAQIVLESEKKVWQAVATSYAAYRQYLSDTLDMKGSGLAMASTFLSSANKEYATLLKTISAVSARELERAGGDVASARSRTESAKLMINGTTVLALMLASGLGFMIIRGVVSRVARLSESMRRLAEGDLSHPLVHQGGDELGRLMNDAEAVRSHLAESMRSVNQATESVRQAAGEIAAGNVDLGSRTEATSGALQQTSSSMSQLTLAVNENAEGADRASAGASEAAESARDSGVMMSKVVQTMGEITTASQRIAEITGVIDGIAFQTNILALNAAVEAARAGEQGRGFAVVASEVRTLAQRSAAAAKEISGLIQSSAERVETGSRLVENAGGSIDRLVRQVAGVAEMVSVIRLATVEQGGEIRQISASLSSLDQSTQQNAALVEQSTAASESLRRQADHLAEAMRRFRLA